MQDCELRKAGQYVAPEPSESFDVRLAMYLYHPAKITNDGLAMLAHTVEEAQPLIELEECEVDDFHSRPSYRLAMNDSSAIVIWDCGTFEDREIYGGSRLQPICSRRCRDGDEIGFHMKIFSFDPKYKPPAKLLGNPTFRLAD